MKTYGRIYWDDDEGLVISDDVNLLEVAEEVMS